jgi:hypothetical protein
MDIDLRRSLHRKVISHLDSRNPGISPGDEQIWRSRADECLRAEIKELNLPDQEEDILRRGTWDEILFTSSAKGRFRSRGSTF